MPLTTQERALLEQPEVAALSRDEQLAYLRQNRRVGFFVTAFAGGVRLFVLGAGGLATAWLAAFELDAETWLRVVLGLAGMGLFAWTLAMGARLARRLAELRRSIE